MFQSEFQPEQYPEESTTERDERIARWNDNAAGFIQGQIDKLQTQLEAVTKERDEYRDMVQAHYTTLREYKKERDEARHRVTELELAYNNVVIRASWMEAYQRERKLRLDGERERDEARRRIAELGQIVEELRFEKEVG